MPAGSFLPVVHIALHSAELSLHAHVQPVCPRGPAQTRPDKGFVACRTPHIALSSVGRLGLRSCPLTDMLSRFDNIHAHGVRGPRVITNLDPGETIDTEPGEAWYSVGIHPWHSEGTSEADIENVRELASDPRVAAIGEAGLDAHRGAGAEEQERIFVRQAQIAEDAGKPMIIHCVGRYGRIIELRRLLVPEQLWIIHGFRGKPELARQLVAAGFGISLGERYNPEVPKVVPPDRLYRETD